MKHKHLLTNILKFSLFASVMIAPIFSIVAKCIYVSLNPNAKDSYSSEYVERYTKITGNNQYVVNNQYQAIYNENNTTETSVTFSISDTDLYKFLPYTETRTITSVSIIAESYPRINITFTNSETYRIDNWQNRYKTFYFTLKNTTNANTGNYRYISLYLLTYTTNKLDNAFYYAIDQLNEQPIFNWTKNTGVYNTINSMTTGLGFGNDNNTIALLLSYWFLNSVIYVVADIIIYSFTWLTHLLLPKEKD